MIFKFIIVLLIAFVSVGSASILWPKFTNRPVPKPLNDVRERIIQTDIGKTAEDILGVSREAESEPINVASVASSLVQTAITTVERQAQRIVIQQTVEQLKKQLDTLPPEEKKDIQDIFCKP